MEIDLSIVIPVYRSAATLPALLKRLLVVLHHMGRRCEIVFVDDGSPDNSWEVLCDLQKAHAEQIIIVQLMRNFGQHNALMCGFRHTRGKYIVTLDDDLQNPPEEIPKLLDAIERTGMDIVYGTFHVKRHNPFRNIGSMLAIAFFKFAFQSSIEATSFRISRREVVENILGYSLNFTYIDGLFAWTTQRIATTPVDHHARVGSTSGYSARQLLVMAFNLFTNFSLLPLQLVSFCGLLVAGGGLLLGFYFLSQYMLSNVTVPGYASTIVAILILGGVQLLSLGIIGEYLGRLHLNVNRKPQYVERQVLIGDSCGIEAGEPLPVSMDRRLPSKERSDLVGERA